MLSKPYIYDIEVFKDYYLWLGQDITSGRFDKFEIRGEGNALSTSDKFKIRKIMDENDLIGFNNVGYDIPLTLFALAGLTAGELCDYSNKTIEGSNWMPDDLLKEVGMYGDYWDEFFRQTDLNKLKMGVGGLKLLGARLGMPKLQELPYLPNTYLTDSDKMDAVRDYCYNDLALTDAVLQELIPTVELMISMQKTYKTKSLLAKKPAGVTEKVFAEMLGLDPRDIQAPKAQSEYTYEIPHILRNFDLAKQFASEPIGYDNGKFILPETLGKLERHGKEYTVGVGGLHSTEKNQSVVAGDDEMLVEIDVASYYPSMMVRFGFTPRQLEQFHDADSIEDLKVVRKIKGLLADRLKAKHSGDKMKSNSLKLILNSLFGKCGDRYSYIYSPQTVIQITMTGQLMLLKLIDMYAKAGMKVVSSNTDAVVVLFKKAEYQEFKAVYAKWERVTGMVLEETHYRALHSLSVNSYVAVTTDGGFKRKGDFAGNSITHTPKMQVVYDAVANLAKTGESVSDYIRAETNLLKFLQVRNSKTATSWQGEPLGKLVRFYHATNGEAILKDLTEEQIEDGKEIGDKVAGTSGCFPLMDLPEDLSLPENLDIDQYIEKAEKIANDLDM